MSRSVRVHAGESQQEKKLINKGTRILYLTYNYVGTSPLGRLNLLLAYFEIRQLADVINCANFFFRYVQGFQISGVKAGFFQQRSVMALTTSWLSFLGVSSIKKTCCELWSYGDSVCNSFNRCKTVVPLGLCVLCEAVLTLHYGFLCYVKPARQNGRPVHGIPLNYSYSYWLSLSAQRGFSLLKFQGCLFGLVSFAVLPSVYAAKFFFFLILQEAQDNELPKWVLARC